MQWLRQKKAEDPSVFWRAVEERRGGPVTFSSFAQLLGRSGGGTLALAGLLYLVNDIAWFEDFPKDNWIARMLDGNAEYEKTEISFALSEVAAVRFVRRGGALQCVGGGTDPEKVPEASRLAQFFAVPIVEVLFHNRSAVFFDLLRRREFEALFAARKT